MTKKQWLESCAIAYGQEKAQLESAKDSGVPYDFIVKMEAQLAYLTWQLQDAATDVFNDQLDGAEE